MTSRIFCLITEKFTKSYLSTHRKTPIGNPLKLPRFSPKNHLTSTGDGLWPTTHGRGSLGSSDCYGSSTIGLGLSSLRSPSKWASIGHGLQSDFAGNHSSGHRSLCLLLLRRQSMEPTGNRCLWTVGSSPVLSPDLSGLISPGVVSPLISISLSRSLSHCLSVWRAKKEEESD